MALKVKHVDNNKIYTTTEAAEAVGVSYRSFIKYFDKDTIPVLKQGNMTFYTGDSINKRIDYLIDHSAGRVKYLNDDCVN